jgi:hypothetical protein
MSSKAPEFGPNDWFVQERYEEFLADPESVDPIWREYFGTNGVGVADSTSSTVNGDTGGTSTGTSAIGASRPPPSPPIRAASNGRPATITTGKPGAVQHRAILPPAPHHAVPGPRADGNESTDASPPAARPTRPATTARPGDIVAAKTAKAAHDARGGGMTTTPLRGDAGDGREEHDVLAGGADRHLGAGGPGEADGRQPDRDQQLPHPEPRRQGLVHPPDRVRHRPRDRRLPENPAVTDVRWVQEEPANQGAWTFLALALPEMIPRLTGIKRVLVERWQHHRRVRPGARGRAGHSDHRGLRNTHAEAGVSAADLLALLRPCSGSVSPNAEGLFSILVARFYGR